MKRYYYFFLSLIAVSFLSSCKKDYSYESGDPDKLAGLGWTLKASDTLKQGCIDTAYYSDFANGKSLTIEGSNNIGNAIYIGLISPSGLISAGNYTSSNLTASMEYTSRGVDIYSLSTSSDYLAVNVINVNDSVIEAEFTASLTNNVSGKTIVITAGKIKAYIGKHNGCGIPPQEGTTTGTGGGGGGVVPPVAVDGDYFPLTQNSWWSYTLPGAAAADTLKILSDNQFNILGNTYRLFRWQFRGKDVDSLFYRRGTNGDYLEINSADAYSTPSFDAFQAAEIAFLKKPVSLGSNWASPEYTGTVGGVATKIKYVFNVTGVNGTMKVNNVTYSNVIKVIWKSQVSTNGGTYKDDQVYESDYAKDIGLIYTADNSGNSFSIKNYQVF